MRKTKEYEMEGREKISVTRNELPALLGCGQPTADQIAKEAGARFYIGRRLLISVDKVKEYIYENSN